MRTRTTLLEIFSTFLRLESDQVKGWMTDPTLCRSMQGCLAQAQAADASENFWSLYWYTIWQTEVQAIAKGHLAAYLQEACYWAIYNTTIGYSSAQYRFPDYFQMAMERLDRILQGFNPKHSLSLKAYARITFSNTIKDVLRVAKEVDICTDWALLNKTSHRRLVKALTQAGLPPEAIARYVLAWRCLQDCWSAAPTSSDTRDTRKLGKPDAQAWEAIAALYNRERHSQLTSPGTASKPEQLEKWLKACAQAIRAYLYPPVISLHGPQFNDQDSGELIDSLSDPHQTSLLAKLIAREERSQGSARQQLNQLLRQAIAALEPQLQQLLTLYYGQNATQQHLAEHFGIKQYTISRRLTRARELLLRAVAQWSRDTLHISLTSDVLDYASTVLEEWLKAYYRPDEATAPESLTAIAQPETPISS